MRFDHISQVPSLEDWWSLPLDERVSLHASIANLVLEIDPATRDRVNACPDRGPELPVSAYPEGCCSGSTRHECRMGLGSIPGQPTTADCLACQSRP